MPEKKFFLRNLLWSVAALAFLWAAWLLAHILVKNDYLVPSFSSAMKKVGEYLKDGAFWNAFFNTFLRTLTAFFISFFGAAVLATAAYLLPSLGHFLSPLVSVMRSLPTMAVILIILVWTTPVQAPVAVAFLALFPLLYSGIFSALKQVDGKLVEMSKIYLPSAAPYVLREAAAALSFSLKLTVSAEVLANTYQSIGGMMQEAKIYVEVPALFALTALVVIAGFLLEGLGAAAAYAARRRI